MAKTNGTGQGGKTLQDRELAASVRKKALTDILLMLNDDAKSLAKVRKWSPYKLRILEKLSSSILPRLNEHAGEGGGPLLITFDNAFTPGTKAHSG